VQLELVDDRYNQVVIEACDLMQRLKRERSWRGPLTRPWSTRDVRQTRAWRRFKALSPVERARVLKVARYLLKAGVLKRRGHGGAASQND
jgi:hypothetical protein